MQVHTRSVSWAGGKHQIHYSWWEITANHIVIPPLHVISILHVMTRVLKSWCTFTSNSLSLDQFLQDQFNSCGINSILVGSILARSILARSILAESILARSIPAESILTGSILAESILVRSILASCEINSCRINSCEINSCRINSCEINFCNQFMWISVLARSFTTKSALMWSIYHKVNSHSVQWQLNLRIDHIKEAIQTSSHYFH